MKLFAILMALSFVVMFAQGADARTKNGETVPRGYGKNPCVTLAFDMATSQQVFTDYDMTVYRPHVIGCEGTRKEFHNVCGAFAYRYAQEWVMSGRDSLKLTAARVGRALDRLSIDGNGYKWFDCTLTEDGSWSYDTA